MQNEHKPSLPHPTRSANRLFAALFAGAYALLLVDRAVVGLLGHAWPVPLLGALIVLLGSLGFPAVERRRSRPLTCAYFAVQLALGVIIFHGSVIGATFLLLVIVGQSVRVLPPWATLLIGAPLPLLHVGMEWPQALREGGTFLVALVFLVALSQAMVKAERARAALDEANRALRDYAAQSEELATARERNRIAREIHDGLGTISQPSTCRSRPPAASLTPIARAPSRPWPKPSNSPTRRSTMSGRELEIVRLLARGATNREIAAALVLAEGTVKNHLTSILGKLGARDRAQAVLIAKDLGII
jgi:DNA-binding CsgD family transcriptional regulator